MGCYGVGVSRTMQAVVEQHHDDKGIIWPVSVAPYEVIITQVKMNDDVQNEVAERIYSEFMDAGIEVLLDDRRERAGVKFNDADLLGIPVRITVGRDAADGKVEYKLRREEDNSLIPVEQAIKDAVELIRAER